jgi:hypothetical protein
MRTYVAGFDMMGGFFKKFVRSCWIQSLGNGLERVGGCQLEVDGEIVDPTAHNFCVFVRKVSRDRLR